ncbi:uncharacterized protein A4U43_C08F26210 [Asparagus officinalis]|nr:uncharacterized protein A4U43_C08F26210 [Asparagus officinalis]
MYLILLALLVPFTASSNFINYTQDFGRIVEEKSPISILKPTTPADISFLLKSIYSSPSPSNVTVAARGAGHSTYGQAQAPGGIIIDTTSLPSSIRVETGYVDVSGGALWVDVLNETLKHDQSPRSWTDYLYLTVGGTLSNAGISGQTFKYGPQVSNVIELDIVTGKGEQVTCSEHKNSDLFYGSLGGLGQFGIITRARIILRSAPRMVKLVKMPYHDFNQFTKDQELLISKEEVDYLEGFLNFQVNSSNKPDYTIELGLYYNNKDIVQKILSELGIVISMVNESDLSYFEFLNRVRAEEEELRKKGLWEVAHPWLNFFVPRIHIEKFKDILLETISSSYGGGPIIIYPFSRHKWNLNMSVMLPEVHQEDDIVYAVSILQSTTPSCSRGSQCLDTLLSQNQKIIDIATSKPKQKFHRENAKIAALKEGHIKSSEGGLGAKQYLPYLKNEREWRDHFCDKWNRFRKMKERFDPLNVLTPGQRIFKRKSIDNCNFCKLAHASPFLML